MEDFKKAIDQIHAPEDLTARTRTRMFQENARLRQEKTGPALYLKRWSRQIVAVAACLVLLIGGAAVYRNTRPITWNTLPAGTTIMGESGNTGLPEIQPALTPQLAELYDSGKTRKIEGVPVVFVREESTDVYIAYWRDGDAERTYVSDPGATEKEFLQEVRTLLKQ